MTYGEIIKRYFQINPIPKATTLLIIINIFSFFLTQFQPLGEDKKINYNECFREKFPSCITLVPAPFNNEFCSEVSPCTLVDKIDYQCFYSSMVIRSCHTKQDNFYLFLGFTPALFKSTGSFYPFITSIFLQKNLLYLIFSILGFLYVAKFIEEKMGSFKLLIIYTASSIITSVIYYLIFKNNMEPLMGMAPAIFALAGIYLFVNESPTKLYFAGVSIFFTILGMLLNESSIISYIASLIILLIGYFLSKILLRNKNIV